MHIIYKSQLIGLILQSSLYHCSFTPTGDGFTALVPKLSYAFLFIEHSQVFTRKKQYTV